MVESVLTLYPQALQARARAAGEAVEPVVIAPIVNLEGGQAVLDERHLAKQPDWTYDSTWSGKSPADIVESRTG